MKGRDHTCSEWTHRFITQILCHLGAGDDCSEGKGPFR